MTARRSGPRQVIGRQAQQSDAGIGCQVLSQPVLVPGLRGFENPNHVSPNFCPPAGLTSPPRQWLRRRCISHEIGAQGSGPLTTSVSHPSRRCTSFNLAAMSISCEQVGRQSPQPTQDVPFRVKAAYSFCARSWS